MIGIIICGGRNYNDRKTLENALNRLKLKTPVILVITGGAKGADTLGRIWAEKNGIASTVINADWDRYGKSAGYLRNRSMATTLMRWKEEQLDERSIGIVAFPGGRGTQMMTEIAAEMNIPVWHPVM